MLRENTSVLNAPNYYVTEHFLYSDFICPCCDTIKIVPGFYTHLELLERMRRETGFDIIINSGYRYKKHNTGVGGSPQSWHLLFATDISPVGDDPDFLKTLFKIALELNFGGIGLYEKHIHLDIRPEAVRWRG
ncbi:D-Ala-D-Ala carboxypeptidase family metallohydrolase [Candidatus Latescibacterota bacterium]